MRSARFLLLLELATLLAAPTSSAQPVFDRLTRADGMPSDYVLAVHQDRWGFMWFGTDAGAARYDGRRVQTFSVDDGLPHPYVQGFAETPDGTLWAATNGGLARRTASGWEPVDSPLGTAPIGRISTDTEGRLVATNSELLARREGDTWRVARWTSASAHKSAPMLDMGQGRLLVSGFRQPAALLLSPEGTDRFRVESMEVQGGGPLGPGVLFCVYRVGDGLVGLFSNRGQQLVHLRLNPQERWFTVESRVPLEDKVREMVVRQGRLFSLGAAGIRALNPQTGDLRPFLLRDHAYSVASDREGAMWIGTFGQGVARLRSTHLTSLTETPLRRIALSGDEAWAVGRGGNVLVGLAETGLPRLRSHPLPARFIDALPGGRYRLGNQASLWKDHAPHELQIFPIQTKTNVLVESSWIAGSVETADTLWVGTYGNGVRRLLKSRDGFSEITPLSVTEGLPTETVEDVARTSAGTWAITRRGLALLGGERARAMRVEDGLPSSGVYSIYEARDGTHWAGTNRGMARLNLTGWRAEPVGEESMAGYPVVSVFERSATPGVLWAVTTRALWRIEDGAAHLVSGFPLVRDPRQTVEHAAYHAPSDRLLLATSAGLNVADLATLSGERPPAPPVAVVEASVNDRPADLLGTPRDARLPDLAPGRHRVEIDVAALQYDGGASVEWREPDGEWSPMPDGRLLLSNIGSGMHTLEFRAVAPGGERSDNAATLTFSVRPRWWERRAAQALLALLGLAVLVGGVRYASQRRLRARVRQLEVAERVRAERERISRDLHDHVGAEIAAILTEAEVGRLKATAEGRDAAALREVEQRARRTMGSLREAIWALGHGALTPEALAKRLGQFARSQTRPHGLAVHAHAQGETRRPLAPAQALALYRIGQEAIRNTVQHSGASELWVTVEATGSRTAVVVRDDGAFIPPEVSGDGGPASGGYGLGNMRARAEALGGTFALTNGDGTTVRAEIPLADG